MFGHEVSVYGHVLLYSSIFSLGKCYTHERSDGSLTAYFALGGDLYGFFKLKKFKEKCILAL